MSRPASASRRMARLSRAARALGRAFRTAPERRRRIDALRRSPALARDLGLPPHDAPRAPRR